MLQKKIQSENMKTINLTLIHPSRHALCVCRIHCDGRCIFYDLVCVYRENFTDSWDIFRFIPFESVAQLVIKELFVKHEIDN